MQACPSQRSSRKKWALAESLVSSGSKEGEAWWAEDSRLCDSQVCFDQGVQWQLWKRVPRIHVGGHRATERTEELHTKLFLNMF